jgi:hypothetical protein
MPAASVTTATTTKLSRQPIVAAANASGAVANSEPTLPMPYCRPVSVANRSGAKRRAKIASDAMKALDDPSPIRVRAPIRPAELVAMAKARQPRIMIAAQTRSTRRGPKRSSAIPTGNCASAKVKK